MKRTNNEFDNFSETATPAREMPQMMQRMGYKWTAFALLTAGMMVLGTLGCAEEVGDIDRTHPNKIEKRLFKGQWYYLQTVIDVPQQSAQGFNGLTNFGANAKVVFEVTEHRLYVLPAVETALNSEAPYVNRKIRNYWDEGKSSEFVEMFVGQPIAAFPIEKHFDVIREYSAATGKQSNVLVENDTDRKWHERRYMRVNWGGNEIMDWAFPTGTSQFSTADHYVQEGVDQYLKPDGAGVNPNLPEFTDEYVSFVTKAYMPPSGADWQGYSCSPYGISNKDCAGSVIKVRHSFKAAPATPDYETFRYTNGEHMDKFGYFLSTRYTYDELWNLTESQRDYKAQRFNLWARTWEYTDMKAEGTETLIACNRHTDCPADDQVLDYQGVQCFKEDSFKPGHCVEAKLLPHAERGLNPVIYHISAGLPEDMKNVFYESADEWSAVFKETVAWLLTLEEVGRYWTKACTTDAQCTDGRADVLLDTTVAIPDMVGLPPHPAAGCPAGSTDLDGVCVQAIGCDVATDPCQLDQLCAEPQAGAGYTVCFAKNADGSRGDQILEPTEIPGPKAVTIVIHPNGDGGLGTVPVRTDWLVSAEDPDTNINLNPDKAAIRFVHASPKAGAAALSVGGSSLTPEVAYSGGWVRQAYPVVAGNVTFKVGGAEKSMTLQAGNAYIVVYINGDELMIAESKLIVDSGVRFFHAAPGFETNFDVGLTSIRAAEGLELGALSDINANPFDAQRITVLQSGAEGDVTCYYTQHEGRCSGWGGEWKPDMDAVYQQKLAGLPDMFLVCENQYDLAMEEANYMAATAEGTDRMKVYHDGRYSTKGTNPYALGEARNIGEKAIYNPCKELVAQPYDLKKIGDIRYKFMYWVGEVQASSPLGYGPSAGDPETGETIWATAYIYGAPTLTYGTWAKDLVDLVNGNLAVEDVITGQYVRDFVQSKGDPLPVDGNDGTLYYGGLANPKGIDASNVFANHAQIDPTTGAAHVATDPMKIAELWEFMGDEQYQKQLLLGLPTVASSYSQDRLDRVRGTLIEDMMINEEVRAGLTGGAMSTGEPLSAEMRAQLSPAAWAGGAAWREQEQHKSRVMANAPCTYDRSFVDDNIYGLAKEFFCSPAEQQQWEAGTLVGKMCLTGDALRVELTSRIFGGVLEHEIGHTVGLRHNFGGSADVFNFFDEYYKVREKEHVLCFKDQHCDEDSGELCDANVACVGNADCPSGLTCSDAGACVDGVGDAWGACMQDGTWVQKFVPRPVMTQSEAEGKLSEWQYSTVMDYGGRFNSDIHGLGKYDYAAIKFGYGKMVDVYRDPSPLRGRMEKLGQLTGRPASWFGYLLSTDGWRYAGTIFSPFYYLENYITVDGNLNRLTVSYERVKNEHAMQTNYDDDRFHWSYVEVPYRFCSDEFRGNLGCYTWDTGVDVGEMVQNALGSIDEYYVFDAFKRERMYSGSDRFINSYYARVMSRFLAILGDSARYYAIYDNIFNDRTWYPDHVVNPHGLNALARASRTSFNALAQILATPAPGSFVRGDDGVYRNVTYDPFATETDLTVPLGLGKFPYTQYLGADHYGFENHVVWVGSFWLKLGALMTLTDSTFYSSSDWVGEQLEIGRSSAVGFNTLYQTEITNLIGGVVAGDLDTYGGVVALEGEGSQPVYRARDLFNPDVDAGKDTIEPGLNNLTMKLWASVLGLANLPSGFDPSFTDSMTVFLEGQGHEFDLIGGGAGVQVAKFHDPFGAKTYVAYVPNYDPARIAPAFTVVKEAQEMRVQWETATGAAKLDLEQQLKRRIEVLDVLRVLHSIYGNLVY